MKNLLSIIVPVYNVEKEVSRCLESIANSVYKNIELIIVNDGSTDSSLDKINEFANKYKDVINIKVINKQNGGLSSARNTGLDFCSGEYVSFVDSDDYIEKDMFQVMIDSMIKYDSEIATCGRIDEYEDFSENNFCINETTVFSPEEVMKKILKWKDFDIASCDKIYSIKIFDTLRFPLGKNSEDVYTIPIAIKKSNRIVHVGKPFYHYVHRSNSITTTHNEKYIKNFYDSIVEMNRLCAKLYKNINDELLYYNNISYYRLKKTCKKIGYKGREYKESVEFLRENWKVERFKSQLSSKEKLIYKLDQMGLLELFIGVKHKFEKLL